MKSIVYTSLAGIQTEEEKVKKSIKDAAKKGHTDVAKILAKELIQSRKAVSKIYASKAQMNSVVMSMQQQLCKCVLLPLVRHTPPNLVAPQPCYECLDPFRRVQR